MPVNHWLQRTQSSWRSSKAVLSAQHCLGHLGQIIATRAPQKVAFLVSGNGRVPSPRLVFIYHSIWPETSIVWWTQSTPRCQLSSQTCPYFNAGGMLNLIRYKVLDGALVQVGGPENEELDLPFKDGSLLQLIEPPKKKPPPKHFPLFVILVHSFRDPYVFRLWNNLYITGVVLHPTNQGPFFHGSNQRFFEKTHVGVEVELSWKRRCFFKVNLWWVGSKIAVQNGIYVFLGVRSVWIGFVFLCFLTFQFGWKGKLPWFFHFLRGAI